MSENCCQLKKSKTLAPIVNALFASVMPGEHIDASAVEIHATESDLIACGGSLKRLETIGSFRQHRMQSLPNCFRKRFNGFAVASNRLQSAFGSGIAPSRFQSLPSDGIASSGFESTLLCNQEI